MVIIDKIWFYMAVLAVIFMMPILLFAIKSDSTAENYANDAVDEFINRACATGMITSSSYEEMINRLDSTGITYDIYLIHSDEKTAPTVLDDGSVKLDSYEKYYEEHRNSEIYETLFPDNAETGIRKYYLGNGDYIRVVVENNTPTLGTRLFSAFTLGSSDTPSILVSRGGYVGHEQSVR